MLGSCSWTVQFYVINSSAAPREITIELEKKNSSFLIFDPRFFTIYPYDDEMDYARGKSAAVTTGSPIRIVIPAKSALVIGRLNNQNYENSRQRFINDRVFNLKRLLSGQTEITPDNFDQYFRKASTGYAWQIPD